MYYESISFSVLLNKDYSNSYKINTIEKIERELFYCKSEIDYMKKFIEILKDNVIKKVSNINNLQIKLGIFDKNNIYHTLFILAVNELSKILSLPDLVQKYFTKTIFIIIYYKNNCIFSGGLSFN